MYSNHSISNDEAIANAFVNNAIRTRMCDGNIPLEGPFTNRIATDMLTRLNVPESVGGGGFLQKTVKNMVNRLASMSDSIKRVITQHRADVKVQQAQAAAIAAAVAQLPPPAPAAAQMDADSVTQWLQNATSRERADVYKNVYGPCKHCS